MNKDFLYERCLLGVLYSKGRILARFIGPIDVYFRSQSPLWGSPIRFSGFRTFSNMNKRAKHE